MKISWHEMIKGFSCRQLDTATSLADVTWALVLINLPGLHWLIVPSYTTTILLSLSLCAFEAWEHNLHLTLLYSGPLRWRVWYTLHVHVPGDPRKTWGIGYHNLFIRYHPCKLYLMYAINTLYRSLWKHDGEAGTHACKMCTRPFLSSIDWSIFI